INKEAAVRRPGPDSPGDTAPLARLIGPTAPSPPIVPGEDDAIVLFASEAPPATIIVPKTNRVVPRNPSLTAVRVRALRTPYTVSWLEVVPVIVPLNVEGHWLQSPMVSEPLPKLSDVPVTPESLLTVWLVLFTSSTPLSTMLTGPAI